MALVGLLVGVLVGVVAPDPALGLAVGGYTAMVLLAFGLTTGLGLRWLPRRAPLAANLSTLSRVTLMTIYVTAAVAVPIHVGLTYVAPSLPRVVPLVAWLVAVWLLSPLWILGLIVGGFVAVASMPATFLGLLWAVSTQFEAAWIGSPVRPWTLYAIRVAVLGCMAVFLLR